MSVAITYWLIIESRNQLLVHAGDIDFEIPKGSIVSLRRSSTECSINVLMCSNGKQRQLFWSVEKERLISHGHCNSLVEVGLCPAEQFDGL